MENKINIAELLTDCPKGMELYSPIFGKVYLDKIRPHLAIVVATDKEQGDFKEEFLYDGRYGMNGECMLFPSKCKTTWEGFQRPFKDGDIVAFDNPYRQRSEIFIFKDKKENNTLSTCYLMFDGDELYLEEDTFYVTRLATEEEKEKLFYAIKSKGYKWNTETKTLEKLPKFKVGDIVQYITDSTDRRKIEEIDTLCNMYHTDSLPILFDVEDEWKSVLNSENVEQNLSDKVDPKFHKGDWIVFNGLTLYVKEVVKGFYRTTSKGGISNSYDWDIDKIARLWTIQDAKDGDVLAEDSCIFIIQKICDNCTAAKTHCTLYDDGDFNDGSILYFDIDSTKLATEEEKQKLFQAIADNGYKWNTENKILEKLIESNEDVDDEILMSGIYFDRKYHADEVELHLGNYEIEIRDGRTYAVFKKLGHKFKVGDRIKQIGSDRHYIIKNIEFDRYILNNNQFIRFTDEHIYELDTNKFDINNLVRFESKVLARDAKEHKWVPAIWGYYDNTDTDFPYKTIGSMFKYCIPYEGNEHLLDKTDDCNEYFKNWE